MRLSYIIRLVFGSIKPQGIFCLGFHDLAFLFNSFLSLFIKRQQAFFDTQLIPELKYLESNWQIIKSELQSLLKHKEKIPALEETDQLQSYLTIDGCWKMFFIKIYGNYVKQNCALCPETTDLIKKVPAIHSAMFSILGEHKYIPKHRGFFRGDLNYHLGLIVPDGKLCKMILDNKTKYWEEGKSILFDDMYEHEVWNDSNEHRVILWAYVERPMPYKWLQRLNKRVIEVLGRTSYIQSGVKKRKLTVLYLINF